VYLSDRSSTTANMRYISQMPTPRWKNPMSLVPSLDGPGALGPRLARMSER
jgi:hypothetical protein